MYTFVSRVTVLIIVLKVSRLNCAVYDLASFIGCHEALIQFPSDNKASCVTGLNNRTCSSVSVFLQAPSINIRRHAVKLSFFMIMLLAFMFVFIFLISILLL